MSDQGDQVRRAIWEIGAMGNDPFEYSQDHIDKQAKAVANAFEDLERRIERLEIKVKP